MNSRDEDGYDAVARVVEVASDLRHSDSYVGLVVRRNLAALASRAQETKDALDDDYVPTALEVHAQPYLARRRAEGLRATSEGACPRCGRTTGNIDAAHLVPGGDGCTWCVPQDEDDG